MPQEEVVGASAETGIEGEKAEDKEGEEAAAPEEEASAAEPPPAATAKAGTREETPALLKPKPKAKPRRAVSPAAKRAPKSTPAFFTGKAAGLPPPPKESCVGPPPAVPEPGAPVGLGAYLVYTEEEGGRLKGQWSKSPLIGAGVLAYLRPGKEIADYKFEKKSAIEIYATDCEVNRHSNAQTPKHTTFFWP